MTPADLSHVRQLAFELDTRLYFTASRGGTGLNGPRSQSWTREVWLTPSGTEPDTIEYWTALHELGHVALGHMGTHQHDPRLLQLEAEAWAWALDHANRPPDDQARAAIGYSLASYLYALGRPRWQPDPVVHRVVEAVGDNVDVGSAFPDSLYLADARHTWEEATATYLNGPLAEAA